MSVKDNEAKRLFADRQAAYNNALGGDGKATKAVLEDLKKFCRAEETCFHHDPRVHAAKEGRREVWLRVQDHLTLSPDEFWDKYKGANP